MEDVCDGLCVCDGVILVVSVCVVDGLSLEVDEILDVSDDDID